jgi:hypothetical protein
MVYHDTVFASCTSSWFMLMIWSRRDRNRSISPVSRRSRGLIAESSATLPRHPLAEDQNKQPTGAPYARDPASDTRGWRVPGWSVLAQLCCSPSAAHCGNPVVNEALHEHPATVSGRGSPNRSRCHLKKCAKEPGHYRLNVTVIGVSSCN